jgi:hypothetical protein
MRRKIFQDFANLFGQKIYGHQLADAHFSFICHSEIETGENSYKGTTAGEKTWRFDFYYNKLCGGLPSSWPRSPARLSLNQGSSDAKSR